MEIFSTREIATSIWIVLLFFISLRSNETAKSFLRLVRFAGNIKIILIFEALAVYVILVCYALSHFMTLGLPQIKSAVFWYLFVGLALIFNAVQAKDDYKPFRAWVVNTFTFLILVEFLTSTFTFPLLVEVVFVPLAAVIAMMIVIAEGNPKHKPLASSLNLVMVLIGMSMISFAAMKFIEESGSINYKQMVEDFLLPVILSLVTIPFFYALFVYVSYENVFTRFQWAFPDESLRRQAKRQGFRSFGLRTKALGRWARFIQSDNPKNMTEIIQSINEAKQVEAWKKNPLLVSAEIGWSPFIADGFLESFGVKMFDYREYDDRWHADSYIIKTKEGFSQNHMIYMMEGEQTFVDTLRLKLTLNDLSTRNDDIELMVKYAYVLTKASVPELDTGKFIEEKIGVANASERIGRFIISVEKEVIRVGKLVIEEYEFKIKIT